MRLSEIQKNILFVLFAIEKNGSAKPVLGMELLRLINKGNAVDLYDSNFRVSCHTLNSNELLHKYRTSSLKLAWSLTDAGRKCASVIYNERVALALDDK